MDVKKIGRIPRRRRLEGSWQGRWQHVCPQSGRHRIRLRAFPFVDDYSRLAYSEILTDEKGPTCRRVSWREPLPTLPPADSALSSESLPTITSVIDDQPDVAAAVAAFRCHA